MIKSKELKTKISHTDSLIPSLVLIHVDSQILSHLSYLCPTVLHCLSWSLSLPQSLTRISDGGYSVAWMVTRAGTASIYVKQGKKKYFYDLTFKVRFIHLPMWLTLCFVFSWNGRLSHSMLVARSSTRTLCRMMSKMVSFSLRDNRESIVNRESTESQLRVNRESIEGQQSHWWVSRASTALSHHFLCSHAISYHFSPSASIPFALTPGCTEWNCCSRCHAQR